MTPTNSNSTNKLQHLSRQITNSPLEYQKSNFSNTNERAKSTTIAERTNIIEKPASIFNKADYGNIYTSVFGTGGQQMKQQDNNSVFKLSSSSLEPQNKVTTITPRINEATNAMMGYPNQQKYLTPDDNKQGQRQM